MSDYVKGEKPRDLDAAKGGGVLGRNRDFMKETDGADQRYGGINTYKNPTLEDQDYAKGTADDDGDAPVPRRKGETKVLKTVTPRK